MTVGPRLEEVGRFRPFELLSPGFVPLHDEVGRVGDLVRSRYTPPAPFSAVEVEVLPGTGSTVLAGLSAPNGDHLLGFLDVSTRKAGIEFRTAGVTTILAVKRVRGRVRRLAFVLCENQPTVLVDTGRGWRAAVTDHHRVAPRVDLRVPETLARFSASWGSRDGTSDLGTVRAGLFGMAGLRDLHLVQHADGSPYVRDGQMFLTATCAGLGFFRQAHWGVFGFDPVAAAGGPGLRLEQTAHLFSHRDGMLLGDHAGQLVRDGDVWFVVTSSWGDFSPRRGVHVRHAVTDDDLLTGVHVLETGPMTLPTRSSTWDPGLTRIDGRWYVSYVESPSQLPFDFHPALAVGPQGAPWSDGSEPSGHCALAPAGAATELHQCEGPVLAQPEGEGTPWRLLASDGKHRSYPVFDLAMRRVGSLAAPYGTNIPHPQLVDLPDGRRLMVTFDGTQYAERVLGYGTHGDVVVMGVH